jgi:polyisoprenoid-binding protein YceI
MTWNIDVAHSQIEFAVRHMMLSKVRGKFKNFQGNITIDANNLAASSVAGTVDVASIETGDGQRDGHLRSADFFDVEKYPKMSFRSTRIEPQGADQYKVYGELTIKDVTREVVFYAVDEGRAVDPWGNRRIGVSATTKINRKDFGLTWNVALETGGWLVGDEVTITAEVELVLQPEQALEVEAA